MLVVPHPREQDFVPLDTANTLIRMLYIYRYYIIIIVWHMKYTYIYNIVVHLLFDCCCCNRWRRVQLISRQQGSAALVNSRAKNVPTE